MRRLLSLLSLVSCVGSQPTRMALRPQLEPAHRWCLDLQTANAGYEVCTQQPLNCELVRRGVFDFGAYAGVVGVGECVAR